MRCVALVLLVESALLLASCTRRQATLNLLVWEGYAVPSFLKALEDQYKCKVNAAYMGSSDELVAKLRGGSASNYDVISPSSDVATSIAESGLALEIRSRLRRGMTPEINAISTIIFLISLGLIVVRYRLRMGRGEDMADIITTVNKEPA
jgi:hypothetical protein